MKQIATFIAQRVVGSPKTSVIGALVIAAAVGLYLFERVHKDAAMDSTIYVAMLTVGSGLLASKDSKGHA